MAPKTPDLLTESGQPLIFRIGNADAIELAPPPDRKGMAIRTLVRSLTVFQKEALVTSSQSGQTWRLASDEGKYLMGHEAAPPPLAFLTVGMVASYMNEILALAKMRGIEIKNIRLIQDNYYSMEGSMPKGTMTAGADHVDLEAQIDSDADRGELQTLVLQATAASPLNGLMQGKNDSLFTLVHNGTEIDPDKAHRVGTPALPDRGDVFGQVQAQTGDWSDQLVKASPSPEAPTSEREVAGSSLAETQSRLLHLRGICTLREDGVKVIEQHLFNPRGDAFYFLSDEGVNAGGQGLAPDAGSYISAGIGFCFMTQFGRFAKMQNSALKQYRIIQDSHFSLGGASGGTGKAGEADPLETHCYLDSDEDDDHARYMLDMAEQTCFLHAFCRTDLKAKVKVSHGA